MVIYNDHVSHAYSDSDAEYFCANNKSIKILNLMINNIY